MKNAKRFVGDSIVAYLMSRSWKCDPRLQALSTCMSCTLYESSCISSKHRLGSFPGHGAPHLFGQAWRPRFHGPKLQSAMAVLRWMHHLCLLRFFDFNHHIVSKTFQKRLLLHCCQFAHTFLPLFDNRYSRNSQILQLQCHARNPCLGFWNNAPQLTKYVFFTHIIRMN